MKIVLIVCCLILAVALQSQNTNPQLHHTLCTQNAAHNWTALFGLRPDGDLNQFAVYRNGNRLFVEAKDYSIVWSPSASTIVIVPTIPWAADDLIAFEWIQ